MATTTAPEEVTTAVGMVTLAGRVGCSVRSATSTATMLAPAGIATPTLEVVHKLILHLLHKIRTN